MGAESLFTKFYRNLPRKPQVRAIAARLGLRPAGAAGHLCTLWGWASDEADGEFVPFATRQMIDDEGQIDGLAEAMESVGWLVITDAGATFPRLRDNNPDLKRSDNPEAVRKAIYRAGKRRANLSHDVPDGVQRRPGHLGHQRDIDGTKAGHRRDKSGTLLKKDLDEDLDEERRGMNSPATPSCPETLFASSGPADARPKADDGQQRSPKKTDPLDAGPSVLDFPVVGGKRPDAAAGPWKLTAARVEHLAATYPGLDVTAEARKALAWCLANPTRRKTPRGMPEFLRKWMDRAQNDAGRRPGPPARASPSNRPGHVDREANIEALRSEGVIV